MPSGWQRPANSLSGEFYRLSLSHRLQQVEGRPETELHIEQAQEKKRRRFQRQAADLHQFQTLLCPKSFDPAPEPHRKLNEKPTVIREVFTDLCEKSGQVADRSCELLFLIFELRLDIGRVGQDKVELALDAGKHVALLHHDIVQTVEPAILFCILHC